MIWILVLVCLAVGCRELYTGFERRQQARHWAGWEERLAALDAKVDALAGDLGRDRARVSALEIAREADQGQLSSDRATQRAQALAVADLEAAVAELRQDQLVRLEQEVVQGTALRGLLSGTAPEQRVPLQAAYGRCLDSYGLRIRTRRSAEGETWSESYFLSGDALAWLPRALLSKAAGRPSVHGEEALHGLLIALDHAPGAVARIGAFAAVRTPSELLFGITGDTAGPAADAPDELARRIRDLPPEDRIAL